MSVKLKKGCTRKVVINLIPPPPHKRQKAVYKAPDGNAYGPSHVDDILEDYASRVEAQFSKWEFRLVQIGEFEFNFCYDRENPLGVAADHARKILRSLSADQCAAEIPTAIYETVAPESGELPETSGTLPKIDEGKT